MLVVQTSRAQVSPVNEMSDKEKLIKTAGVLEEHPLDEKAKELRQWAMLYVIQTPDVSVTVCTNAILPAMDKKYKYGSELLTQYTIGMAAFKLSNPGAAKNEDAAQLAGVESLLRAYQAMVKEKPKAQWAGLDELVARKNNGELTKYLDENKCKDDKGSGK